MHIERIDALDARGPADAESASRVGQSEFPSVLRSTLDEGEGANDGSSSALDRATEGADPAEREASDPPRPGQGTASETPEGSESERVAIVEDLKFAEAEDGATTDAAALGAFTTALLVQLRDGGSTEAATADDGRRSGLDAEEASRGLAQRGHSLALGAAETDVVEAGEMRESITTESHRDSIAVQTPDPGATRVAAPVATSAAEPAPKRAGRAEAAQETGVPLRNEADSAEAFRVDVTERQDQNQRDPDAGSGARENEGRPSEQALFDRAAEGARSGQVDASLRSAIENAAVTQRAPEAIAVEAGVAINNPIAGAVTEMTPTATPGVPTPPAASDAIAVQTEWLASRGGGTARLLLSPPSLGEIAIRVTLQGGVVHVVMVAQEALAQAVAEDQSERLAQAFSSRDLRLESFEVRRGEAQAFVNEGFTRFAESNAGRQGQAEGDPAAGTETSRVGIGGDLDRDDKDQMVMPEIVSVGPEAGVDLLI